MTQKFTIWKKGFNKKQFQGMLHTLYIYILFFIATFPYKVEFFDALPRLWTGTRNFKVLGAPYTHKKVFFLVVEQLRGEKG